MNFPKTPRFVSLLPPVALFSTVLKRMRMTRILFTNHVDLTQIKNFTGQSGAFHYPFDVFEKRSHYYIPPVEAQPQF